MLSSLQIENVAVIQKAEVHFKPGLNVLTGETGAGKSILIVPSMPFLVTALQKTLCARAHPRPSSVLPLNRCRMPC